MDNWTVYMHICPNNKKYVGITSKSVKERWQNGKAYKRHGMFGRAIAKYGWDNIEHKIMLENLTAEEAKNKEKELIAKHNTMDEKFGYNLTAGGDGNVGFFPNDETRRKMSEAHKGKIVSDITRKRLSDALKNPSEKTRKKLSESKKGNQYCLGRKHSESAKQSISVARKGKPLSEEHCRKLSEAHKGKMCGKNHPNYGGRIMTAEWKAKMGEAHRKPVFQVDKSTNEIISRFVSVAQAAEMMRLNPGNICKVAKGKVKTCGGYIWRYV